MIFQAIGRSQRSDLAVGAGHRLEFFFDLGWLPRNVSSNEVRQNLCGGWSDNSSGLMRGTKAGLMVAIWPRSECLRFPEA